MKLLITALILVTTLAGSNALADDASNGRVYCSCDRPGFLSYAELKSLGITNFYLAKQAQGRLQQVVQRACKRSGVRTVVLIADPASDQGKALAMR